MAGRLVWLHGPSGAGKKTLAAEMEGDAGHPVRTWISLSDPLTFCRESLLTEKIARDALGAKLVARYRPDADQLAKGQSSDIWDWHPRRDVPLAIGARLPQCSQEIIVVWADRDELYRRCVTRPNPEGYDWDQHKFDVELQLLIGWVMKLGLPTLCVKNPDERPLAIGESPPGWPM